MKRSLNHHLKALAMATLCMVVWTFGLPHAAFSRAVEVPPMTPLQVVTMKTISPGAVNVGDQISLQVVNDVKIDGVTVIAAGARVMARITQAGVYFSLGRPAVLGLSLESVEAVDGTMVPISGAVNQAGKDKKILYTLVCMPLVLFKGGGAADLLAGSQIMANTIIKVSIAV
jgi:hypothetical protein